MRWQDVVWIDCPVCKREDEPLQPSYSTVLKQKKGEQIPEPTPDNTDKRLCDTHEGYYCELCYEELADDDVFGEYESRGEFWGAPCSEYVAHGYVCHSCGETVNF